MSSTLGDIQPEKYVGKVEEVIKSKAANSEINKSLHVIKNEITDLADGTPAMLKEKIADNLAFAADTVHEKSDTAQEFLNSGAERVHDYAQTAIGKVNTLGHSAAEVLESSSDYVKDFNLAETREKLRYAITNRPDISLAVAGVFGLLLGLAIGRRTSRS